METKPPVPRAILVGIQVPSVDDVAHAASIEELGHLVKTLGYEIVGTMSQKRDAIDGGTVLGKGRLAELAAITGGTGVVGSMAVLQKSKARERFENADVKKPDAPQIAPDPEAPPRPEFVIVDHEMISPSQARNLERATGAQVRSRSPQDTSETTTSVGPLVAISSGSRLWRGPLPTSIGCACMRKSWSTCIRM
jgi:GTP-binding protein HflX